MEFTKEDDKAVKWCEDNYPDMTKEYKKIAKQNFLNNNNINDVEECLTCSA